MAYDLIAWRDQLQAFLHQKRWRQMDFVTQSEVTILRTTGGALQLSKDTVSKWLTKGEPRFHEKREIYVKLVDFFVLHGVIKTVGSANAWLAMAGHSLTEREASIIFDVESEVYSSWELSAQQWAALVKYLKNTGIAVSDSVDTMMLKRPRK